MSSRNPELSVHVRESGEGWDTSHFAHFFFRGQTTASILARKRELVIMFLNVVATLLMVDKWNLLFRIVHV